MKNSWYINFSKIQNQYSKPLKEYGNCIQKCCQKFMPESLDCQLLLFTIDELLA